MSQVALVHEEFKALVSDLGSEDSSSTESSVELVEYHPEGSTYSVSTESDGLLILSEVWYPEGWSATVDGDEVPLVRANYILRALPISAGEHDVVLSYNPPVAQRAGIVGGIGSLLLALFIAFSCYKYCDTCTLVKQ